ncbi:unnamed protein product [Staurois parvus]|uniref:Uncharacterized protein n=1 Tax=Staurois parvus TaxID=386267 RepID=A0ABN9CRS8_9NEOB|nr:unnamed protein product [Staurois parvus]
MSARSCDHLCPITADHISATCTDITASCQCSSMPPASAHQCHISVPTSAHHSHISVSI